MSKEHAWHEDGRKKRKRKKKKDDLSKENAREDFDTSLDRTEETKKKKKMVRAK